MKTSKEPKISVIIPCYNQGEYLDRAVDSVLSQTYQNFEIIVVNDGSTDSFTKSLLKEYSRDKVVIYNLKHKGVSSARNFGYLRSNGDFIQFLDSDDFLEPEKFMLQIKEFQKDPEIDICYTNYDYYVNETGQILNPYLLLELTNNPYMDFLYRWQRDLSIPIHAALFRRKIFGGQVPFIEDIGVGEDWIMWIGLAKNGSKFKFLNQKLVYYRLHHDSTTQNKDYSIYFASKAIHYIGENLVDEKDKNQYNIESQKYLKRLIEVFFLAEKDDEIRRYQEQIKKMEDSISWKITLPIRAIRKFLNLVHKQGIIVTTRNIILKILKE